MLCCHRAGRLRHDGSDCRRSGRPRCGEMLQERVRLAGQRHGEVGVRYSLLIWLGSLVISAGIAFRWIGAIIRGSARGTCICFLRRSRSFAEAPGAERARIDYSLVTNARSQRRAAARDSVIPGARHHELATQSGVCAAIPQVSARKQTLFRRSRMAHRIGQRKQGWTHSQIAIMRCSVGSLATSRRRAKHHVGARHKPTDPRRAPQAPAQ